MNGERTGYESYSAAERAELIRRLESDIRQESWAAEGDGLRAEVARANVREFRRRIEAIRRTK